MTTFTIADSFDSTDRLRIDLSAPLPLRSAGWWQDQLRLLGAEPRLRGVPFGSGELVAA